MKDYLEHSGVVLDSVTPASVIKAAFAARIIADGEVWMQALDACNRMSHSYDLKVFERIIDDIHTRYLALFDALYSDFLTKAQPDA